MDASSMSKPFIPISDSLDSSTKSPDENGEAPTGQPPANQVEPDEANSGGGIEVNDSTKGPQTTTTFAPFHFNDQARLHVTLVLLGIFGMFLLFSLMGWIFLAFASNETRQLTKQFSEFAQFVITPLVGIVSGASGFYFGTKFSEK
jgi:hypothetical protein